MNTKITLENPRLTAYALGEMADSAECARIEAALQESEELRAFVKDVQALEETLATEFAQEEIPASEPAQVVRSARFGLKPVATFLAAAAAIVLCFAWLPYHPHQETLTVAEHAPRFRSAIPPEGIDVDGTSSFEVAIEETGEINVDAVSDLDVTVASTPIDSLSETHEASDATTLWASTSNSHVESTETGTRGFSIPSTNRHDRGTTKTKRRFTGEPVTGMGTMEMDSLQDAYHREHHQDRGALLPHPSQESYATITDQAFTTIERPGDERTTFSTDVDTASYSNVRRFLSQGQRPPRDAVRIEEMINYFHYDYPNPTRGEHPFSLSLEVNDSPWKANHRLLRIGLKAKDVMVDERPDSNLVFLIDVSGSMSPYNKLPLLKKVLRAMVAGLTERDRVAMVVYSGQSTVHLPPTPGHETSRLIAAIDQLRSGGSTNGESGIQEAYALAKKHRLTNGVNRVLLATDGDFNVGTTDTDQLVAMAKARAKEDQIFLTVLGFGEGNLQDARMEQLANQVDGSYHYIDSEREGRKVLIDEMSATLVPMAKDVKVQVEFNPAKVHAYRLIGYANRQLANRDFTDDKKDAGDMGAGHTVTAFYEIIPANLGAPAPGEEPLKYRLGAPAPQKAERAENDATSPDLVTVRVRYKEPDATTSQSMETALIDDGSHWNDASIDFKFAAAVTAFGMHLRESPHSKASLTEIRRWAEQGLGNDEYGWRREFIDLVEASEPR